MNTPKISIIMVLAIMLLTAGSLSRWVRASRASYAMERTPLASPLSSLPESIGEYTGSDVPLSLEVLEAAQVESYVHREYISNSSGRRIGVYVGYWGRENTGMGHGPEICYPSSGWSIDRPSTNISIPASGLSDEDTGDKIEVAMHRFVRAEPEGIRRRSVGFVAVVGGQFRSSSVGFYWHEPRSSSRGSSRYLAQVHVSAVPEPNGWQATETDIIEFMELLIPELSRILPGLNGPSEN